MIHAGDTLENPVTGEQVVAARPGHGRAARPGARLRARVRPDSRPARRGDGVTVRRRMFIGALVTAVLTLALLGHLLSAVRWVRSLRRRLASRAQVPSARPPARHTNRKESAHARTS